jgi:hypothetical protein
MNRSQSTQPDATTANASAATGAFEIGAADRKCKRERPETALRPAFMRESASRGTAYTRAPERGLACNQRRGDRGERRVVIQLQRAARALESAPRRLAYGWPGDGCAACVSGAASAQPVVQPSSTSPLPPWCSCGRPRSGLAAGAGWAV